MIIAISGRTASGKTTLARALAKALGGTAGSFGDYVRKLAAALGREPDRPNLQAIGQAAVEVDAAGFLADFLRWLGPPAGGDLVLDGLRHASVRDALLAHAEAVGTQIHFVHIRTDDHQRAERLRARGDDDDATASHDAHPSEADVRDRLSEEADLRITRSEDLERMVAEIMDSLRLA